MDAVVGSRACVDAERLESSTSIQNPVARENSKRGNPRTEWDVDGSGDPTIRGFVTDISINKGDTARFKIDTDSSAYTIDIFRLGFYGGDGARKISTVTPSAMLPQLQPECLRDPVTGLVDCGNWAVSASWAVPSDAVSGVYIARLRRSDTGGASHILFVVRDDASTSALLFQTSDTTWAAYNDFGGNSLYSGSPARRAFKVSYNRPLTSRAWKEGFFDSEYPMLRWIEANGYDVSYTTGVDTDRRGNLIERHKIFMSVGQDEYWSGRQRANVEAARDAGVHLAFFSGNEMFWKTRWEASIDGSGTSYRTLVCYKDTHANAMIDPAQPPTWTGTWRDARFSPAVDGGQPENALTGTLFMVNGERFDSIVVPAEDGLMRFWRHTSIADLAPGTSAELPAGVLGGEWDCDVDNGFRPPGLIHLSTTTLHVKSKKLLDNGSRFGSGTATHHLTLYRASSGALVFGAGTIRWAWGLDSCHDRSFLQLDPTTARETPTDVRMQQATVNLLADMGVQPCTLQPGLVATSESSDTDPPSSTITSPTDGATIVAGRALTVTGTATDSGGGRVAAVEVSTDGGITWHPARGRSLWMYTFTPANAGPVTIKSRATDDSGNIETPRGVTLVTIPPGSALRMRRHAAKAKSQLRYLASMLHIARKI